MKKATHKEIVEELFATDRKLFSGIYSISEPFYDPSEGDITTDLSGMSDPQTQSIYTLMIQPERGSGHFVHRYIVEVGYIKSQPCRVVIDAARLLNFLTSAHISYSSAERRVYISYEGSNL